mgnify:CR=1 FL=1
MTLTRLTDALADRYRIERESFRARLLSLKRRRSAARGHFSDIRRAAASAASSLVASATSIP